MLLRLDVNSECQPFMRVQGREMLLEQAKEQQKVWLGKIPPHTEMQAALEQSAASIAPPT